MSVIKYPVYLSNSNSIQLSDGHTNRGMRLEADLNDTNKYYRECDKALIYKKPTPVQVVRVEYPARNKAKIVEAYYKTPSTTDYNGIYRGRYIDFEAKETKNKTSFPFFLIHPHQITHLKKVHKHGGIGFFVIRFSTLGLTYLVDAPELISYMEQSDKRSVPLKWFQMHAHSIPEGYIPRLDYLKIVDYRYFKEDKT